MKNNSPTDKEKRNTEYFIFYTIIFLITLNMFAYGVKQSNTIMIWCGVILCLLPFFMMFKTGYDHGWELKRIQVEDKEE